MCAATVNLTQLILSPSLNFASAANDQFTIINNDGSDAVIGTFAGLPQNKKLYIGQELFQISYTGGTGNDVVLNRLVTPPAPQPHDPTHSARRRAIDLGHHRSRIPAPVPHQSDRAHLDFRDATTNRASARTTW